MASNFNFGVKKNKAPRESGPAFRWLVRLCGLAVIGGVFLPVLEGMDILTLAENFQKGAAMTGGYQDFFSGFFTAASTGGVFVKIFSLLPYVLFPLIGLSMLLRGKYAGGPFTILILFLIAAFILFRMFGEDAATNTNFFAITGLGFWISVGGLFAPFLGMFFLDKSI